MTHRIKSVLDQAAAPLFQFRRRPFGPGYQTSKRNLIVEAVSQDILRKSNSFPKNYGIAMDERVVEYPWFFANVDRVGKMLDAGSTFNHDFLLERAPLAEADLTIMTLAPEKRCYWYRNISYVFGDLRRTYFADNSFDTVASISTIEHIGLDNNLLYSSNPEDAERDENGFVPAVKEFKRILKPGGVCLISFPYGKKENLGWYQVFDQDAVQRVIEAFEPSSHAVDYFGYTDSGWSRGSAESLSHATVFDVHTGKGRENDLAASSRAVACLRLIA